MLFSADRNTVSCTCACGIFCVIVHHLVSADSDEKLSVGAAAEWRPCDRLPGHASAQAVLVRASCLMPWVKGRPRGPLSRKRKESRAFAIPTAPRRQASVGTVRCPAGCSNKFKGATAAHAHFQLAHEPWQFVLPPPHEQAKSHLVTFVAS